MERAWNASSFLKLQAAPDVNLKGNKPQSYSDKELNSSDKSLELDFSPEPPDEMG
jgi:hypothetical protein